ncbi:MAG: hypothetical protein AB7T49_11200 [Oligoflexales bacterium]
MKRMIWTALMVSSTGFAVPGLNLVDHSKGQSKAPFNGECTDFSGEWKGRCSLNGQDLGEQSYSIDQTGCSRIDLHGPLAGSFPIGGGMRTVTETTKSDTQVYSEVMNWNEGSSALNGTMDGVSAPLDGSKLGSATHGTLKFSMEQGQLVFTAKVSTGPNATNNIECKYSAQ